MYGNNITRMIYYYITSVAILLVYFISKAHSMDPDKFYRNPEDVVADLGEEKITLQCRLKPFESSNNAMSQMGKAEWLKNGVLLGEPLPERYIVTGNARIGDYNLRIHDVQYEDVGKYQCRTLDILLNKMYISREANIYVRGSNQLPEIGYRPNEPLKLNKTGSFDLKPQHLTLWCWVQGVSPRPLLSWKVNSKLIETHPWDEVVEEDENTHLYTVSSRLSFRSTVKTRHISCTSKVPSSVNDPLTLLIPVNMFKKPVVTFNSPYDSFEHKSLVEFECSSKPDAVYWTWYLERKVLKDCISTTCIIHEMNRDYLYRNIFCKADNEVGMDYAFFQINIRDLPPLPYAKLLANQKKLLTDQAKTPKNPPVSVLPSIEDEISLNVGVGILACVIAVMICYVCWLSPNHLLRGEKSRVQLAMEKLEGSREVNEGNGNMNIQWLNFPARSNSYIEVSYSKQYLDGCVNKAKIARNKANDCQYDRTLMSETYAEQNGTKSINSFGSNCNNILNGKCDLSSFEINNIKKP